MTMYEEHHLTVRLEEAVRLKILDVANNLSADAWGRIRNFAVPVKKLSEYIKYTSVLTVSKEFEKIILAFSVVPDMIPAGFRPELVLAEGCLCVDLKRDISYAENGVKRPTNVLFSCDSANPYEVAPFKNFIANLTCNPLLIYDSFINNPSKNVGGQFKNRQEVMAEIGRILGPGCDISVEVDNPFADESAILEEIAEFEEILTPYRLVIKTPHTGPLNRANYRQLLDDSFDLRFEDGSIEDNLLTHNLAYRLQQRGYRINFTLMFEPHQTALALLARPYFINAFYKYRMYGSQGIRQLLDSYDATGAAAYIVQLREHLLRENILSKSEAKKDGIYILAKARNTLRMRNFDSEDGSDGFDAFRHSLRVLRNSNLPDTRLIVCSFGEEEHFIHLDHLLTQPEFADMAHRVVITAPPSYLARFASASGIIRYQRDFLIASGQS